MPVRLALLLLLLACAVGSVSAQTTNLRLQLQGGSLWVPPVGLDDDRSVAMPVRILPNQSGSTLQGPIILRSTLPAGVALREAMPAAGQEALWTCGTAGQELTCSYGANLVNPASGNIALRFGVAPDYVVPAGHAVEIVVRAESASIPHNPAACATAGGNTTTTCAKHTLTVSKPVFRLESVAHSAQNTTYNNAPMTVGGWGLLRLSWLCEVRPGEACSGLAASAVVELPEGLHWRANPSFPLPAGVSCEKTVLADAELVTCSSSTAGSPWVVPLYVDVSPDVIAPTVIPTLTTFDSPYQPAPADCALAPADPNCTAHDVPIVAGASPQLVFRAEPLKVEALPGTLRREGTLRLTMRFGNDGSVPANQATLQLRLPPQVAFVAEAAGSGLACSASGAVETGQTLVCLRAGGIPASSGTLSAAIDVAGTAQLPVPQRLPVLFEISGAATGSNARLDVCAASPGLGACARLEIPTVGACNSRFDGDGIYCDGYEATPES